jgi:hypothetical protein
MLVKRVSAIRISEPEAQTECKCVVYEATRPDIPFDTGWGDKSKRYDRDLLTAAEPAYDLRKRECHTPWKVFEKFKNCLYGARFVVRTDAMTLATQLNRPTRDLPGALVTQLAWIRDFEVRHLHGAKNIVADALLRQLPTERDVKDMKQEDIDEHDERQRNTVRIWPIRAQNDKSMPRHAIAESANQDSLPSIESIERESQPEVAITDLPSKTAFHADEHSEGSQQIVEFLLSGGRRPQGVPYDFKRFRKKWKIWKNVKMKKKMLKTLPDCTWVLGQPIVKTWKRLKMLKMLRDV